MKKITSEKLVEHPLESAMGISPGSTVIQTVEHSVEKVETELFDEKDESNENELDSIIEQSLDVFELFKDEIETSEDRFKARMGEVGLSYLNLAREAIKDKMALKAHKEKLLNKAKPGKTVNNLIVADRNSLLKDILSIDNDSSQD